MKMTIRAMIMFVVGVVCLGMSAQAATITWDDGAGDDYWISGDNWTGTPDNTSPVNGDSVVLTATTQSFLDYAWTIETGQSLTSSTSDAGDDLGIGRTDTTVGSLRLASGGTMDIGFMRPRSSAASGSGNEFIIEAGASLNTDIYGLGIRTLDITFIADASGVTTWTNSSTSDNTFQIGLDTLTVDLSSYNIANGATLVLVDYAAASPFNGQTFASTNLTAGWSGTIDYAYDQGGSDLAIALILDVPTKTIVQWGEPGGSTDIVTGNLDLSITTTYSEGTAISPTASYYPNATGRTPVFNGARASVPYAGGAYRAYDSTPDYLGLGLLTRTDPWDPATMPYETNTFILVWESANFLDVGGPSTLVSFSFEDRLGSDGSGAGDSATYRYLLQDKNGDFHISQEFDLGATDTVAHSYGHYAGELTWSAYTPFNGVSDSIGATTTPELDRFKAIGLHTSTVDPTTNWALRKIQYFHVSVILVDPEGTIISIR